MRKSSKPEQAPDAHEWTLRAAEALCGAASDLDITRPERLDLLHRAYELIELAGKFRCTHG